jgi:hypothetical protein
VIRALDTDSAVMKKPTKRALKSSKSTVKKVKIFQVLPSEDLRAAGSGGLWQRTS